MTGSYTENSVKRKAGASALFAKVGLILTVAVLFVFGFLINQQIIVIACQKISYKVTFHSCPPLVSL